MLVRNELCVVVKLLGQEMLVINEDMRDCESERICTNERKENIYSYRSGCVCLYSFGFRFQSTVASVGINNCLLSSFM